MLNIYTMSDEDFSSLPLIIKGESKEIRDAGKDNIGNRICVIKFRPTIYSFTANRTAWVEGSDILRLRASKILVNVLKRAGIQHAYREISDKFVLADLIENPPNIEVVIKNYHGGTSKHKYFNMDKYKVRKSNKLFQNIQIKNEDSYPHTIVRFDWRNPFWNPDRVKNIRSYNSALPEEVFDWPDELKIKVRMADECLPEPIADWFIDVEKAKETAQHAMRVLSEFLAEKNIVIHDLCLFITEDGQKIYGEIDQDCGRFRHFDLGSLDKDVWRAGGSAEQVLQKWNIFSELIEK